MSNCKTQKQVKHKGSVACIKINSWKVHVSWFMIFESYKNAFLSLMVSVDLKNEVLFEKWFSTEFWVILKEFCWCI